MSEIPSDIPKALRGMGFIGCTVMDHCEAKNICGRIQTDVFVTYVPVDPTEPDLSKASSDLDVIMREWANVHEPECTRKDNFWKGDIPVSVLRTYWFERIY